VFARLIRLPQHLHLIGTFVKRDVRGRYKGSAMGLFWSLVHPLVMLCLFWFLFSAILRVKVGADEGTTIFGLYLAAGMLPWNAFSESLARSTGIIVENGPLIKRTLFPSEILPIFLVISGIVHELIGLGVLLAVLLITGHTLSPMLMLLPVVMVFQIAFTLGLSWVLAAVNVFVRDVGQLLTLVLTLWVFLTPIYYPPSVMPERFRPLVALNPMAGFVDAYRAIILRGALPHAASLVAMAAASLPAFLIGHVLFQKMRPSFPDVI
jgi:ABC-type polysaccharide/polyol phosphate export permease